MVQFTSVIDQGREEPPNTAPPRGICDVHPPSARPIGQSGRAGGSRRVFELFLWLGVRSVKVVLSRRAQQYTEGANASR